MFNNVMASLLLPSFQWYCNPQQIPPAVQTSFSIRTLSIFFKHFLDELCAPKLKGSVLVFKIAVSKLVTQILRAHFDSNKTCFFYLNRQTSTKCREKITSTFSNWTYYNFWHFNLFLIYYTLGHEFSFDC